MKHLLIWIFACAVVQSVAAQVRLPRLVRDSMVLQRNTKLNIWGWAAAGEKVAVHFNGKRWHTAAGKNGKWSVVLPPMKAGGPYTMTIAGSNKIQLNDILVGDVWLCTGQSNMVHYMELHKEAYAQDIAQANNPFIRQFLVPSRSNLLGKEEDLTSGSWKWANPQDIKQFSVVAYFFAQHLYQQYKVPVGIINASVGGTPVEAWTSEEGLQHLPQVYNKLQQNKDTAYVNGKNRAADAANSKLSHRGQRDKGMLQSPRWFDTTYQPVGWSRIQVPGYWEDAGIRNLDGIVWYRREVTVPQEMLSGAATLHLGRIVDADMVYVNGTLVGQTSYQYPQRRYPIPDGVLKAGKNIITVRVTNQGGKGGFVPDKPYHIAAAGHQVDLSGYWHYKVGAVFAPHQQVAGINPQNEPAALFNGMITPVANYGIKGVVWYQGETNAGKPMEYAQLLPAFIHDWRKHFGQSNLPFVLVQLPNFMEKEYLPAESNWALMREAQASALSLPNTGMAVTIDLGEWNDIHPGNKKEVGVRAALVARRIAYGEEVVYSGPRYVAATAEGNKMTIRFDHVGGGLVTHDGEPPGNFALAGADRKFYWAETKIEGEQVIAWSSEVPNPVYVRYAWADNPHQANLYNKEGLPAVPFRTDNAPQGASAAAAVH